MANFQQRLEGAAGKLFFLSKHLGRMQKEAEKKRDTATALVLQQERASVRRRMLPVAVRINRSTIEFVRKSQQ